MKPASELTDRELNEAIAKHEGQTILWRRYTTDINAAIELLEKTSCALVSAQEMFSLLDLVNREANLAPIIATHSNPARAISEAYYTLHIMQPEETE